MRWSLTIGSFMGTAVRIHVTFLLLLGWIGFAAYQRGGAVAARDSIMFIVAIFICVVLHEFGHILTARRYGIVSPVITLLPIGGVADMEKMPDKPREELLIALAGPAVNLVIAALLILFLGAVDLSDAIQIGDPSVNLLKRLAAVNIFLAAFNLIPAFPMDGGRVLRAALSIWIGKDRATRIAAQIGQGFAFLLGFLGLFGNPLLLFIAIFVYIAAAGEAQMTSLSEAARGLKAADAMEMRIAVIERNASVREAVDILLATSQDEFPVVDGSRRLSGFLSRTNIIEALRASEPDAPIAPFVRLEPETIDGRESIDAVLPKLTGGEAVGVTDEEGRFLGLLTRQSLAEIMMIKDVRPDWRFSPRDDSRPTVA